MAGTLPIRDTARREDAPWLTLRMREAMEAWLFISPTLAGFLIFFVGPLIAVVWYSLTEWNLLTQQATFVGLDNYSDALFRNPDFWHVVRNSVIFAVGLVPLNMALALLLALALSRRFAGVIVFRTVFFAPVVTSAVAWAIVWKFLLQGEAGFINQILAQVGIDGPNWLREPNWAMAAVIVTRVIKMVGPQHDPLHRRAAGDPARLRGGGPAGGCIGLADLPLDRLAAAGSHDAGHHGHHHDRVVQGLRPHLSDDRRRP